MLQLRQYRLDRTSMNLLIPSFMQALDIADNVAYDSGRLREHCKQILWEDFDTVDDISDMVSLGGYRAAFNAIDWIDRENDISEDNLIVFELVAYED